MRKRDLAIGAMLLLLMSRRKNGGAALTTTGPRPSFSTAWDARVRALLARARQGDAWAARMAARLGSPEAGAAAARWIGIESGGDPRASSSLDERGLAQVSKVSLAELGLTDADFAAMNSARTTDDQHADMAAAVIGGEVVRVAAGGETGATGWGTVIGPIVQIGKGRTLTLGASPRKLGIGVAKLRHGLPLLLNELRKAGVIEPTIPPTLAAARAKFKPSARLANFASGAFATTGVPTDDLLLRFMAPVAVVAAGEGAIGMGATSQGAA